MLRARDRPATSSAWLRWAAFALLSVGVALGWLLTPTLFDPERIRLSLGPTAVLLVLRVVAEALHDRIRVGSPAVVGGYALHAVALLVGAALNPFLCVYAFLGFVDADRFLRGRLIAAAVVVTGITCGFGQAGGLPGVTATPTLFVALAAVNITLALIMMSISQSREREVVARETAVAALARAHEENLALHTQLVGQAREKGIAEERARLSRELHDTVAQGLVGVIRQLENLPTDLEPVVQHRVERAEQTARDCLTETRRAVDALGPQQLEDVSLAPAVRTLLDDWSRTHGVTAQLRLDGTPTSGPGDDVVLRVVQEALTNIAHHATASSVTVTLSWLDDDLVVDICDDGIGFDPDTVVRGRGLAGMAERLAAAAGRLVIESQPGLGTTVVAVLPR